MRLARHQAPRGQAYHLTNPAPISVSTVVDRLRSAGHRLASPPSQEWANRVSAAAPDAPEGSALPLVALLVSDLPGLREHTSVRIRYDQTNTLRGLAESGIACPPMSRDLLDRYVRFLTETGFLPEPAGPHHGHAAPRGQNEVAESLTRLPARPR